MGVKISSKGDIPITAINNRFLFPSPKVKDSEIINAHIPTQNVVFDNVMFNGRQIKKADCRKYLFVNPYIENLQFK